MGARHETQVAAGDGWQPVSELPQAYYQGRENGFQIWQAPVAVGVPIRAYHRSNSGTVTIVDGAEAGPEGTTVKREVTA